MKYSEKWQSRFRVVSVAGLFLLSLLFPIPGVGQGSQLTAIQREVERQSQRLTSIEVEERRDALMRLANLKRPEASRAAAAALGDKSPTVRAAAVHAILWLPSGEVATLLFPLLKDKSEFVRREAVFALGDTRHGSAVAPLSDLLFRDKQASVRAGAAIALGKMGDEAAVPALLQAVTGNGSRMKPNSSENEFVVRSAVRSLGQIGSRAAVPTLIAALQDEINSIDTRREAATALGLIGDSAALSALETAFRMNADPYLTEAARIAIQQINRIG